MGGITGMAVAGTDITSILNYWADIGVFAYVLPFLLIFAVVYGILSKTEILAKEANKGVNAVIAIAVGLLALQWDYVPNFFATIFPFAGIGIAVLLVALILMGLFGGQFIGKDDKVTTIGWIFFTVGAVIAVIVVLSSFSGLNVGSGFGGYLFWDRFGPGIITLIVLAILIGLVVGKKPEEKKP